MEVKETNRERREERQRGEKRDRDREKIRVRGGVATPACQDRDQGNRRPRMTSGAGHEWR